MVSARRILIHNSSRATKGGGTKFLKELVNTLMRYGYNIEAVTNPAPSHVGLLNMLREADVVCWYGESDVGNGLRFVRLACSMKKPVIRILGGTVLIRKPDRPSYLLSNVLTAFNIFAHTKLHPTLFYGVRNTDDYKLLKRFGVPVLYTPPGVDTKAYRPAGRRDSRFTIICNATPATWVKGTDFLLKIIPEILYTIKEDIVLVIITGGLGQLSFRQRLMSLEKMFSDNVLCIDKWLSQEEMCKLLGKAHLLIFPSRSEGFGNLVLEAQICGVLVVAFNIPGAPRDVVVPNLTGGLVKPYNLKDFVKEIHRLYIVWRTKPELYAYMQMKARENALRFDWSVVGKLFASHINEVYSRMVKI